MAFGGIVGKSTTTYTDEEIQEIVSNNGALVWSEIDKGSFTIKNTGAYIGINSKALNIPISEEDDMIYFKFSGQFVLKPGAGVHNCDLKIKSTGNLTNPFDIGIASFVASNYSSPSQLTVNNFTSSSIWKMGGIFKGKTNDRSISYYTAFPFVACSFTYSQNNFTPNINHCTPMIVSSSSSSWSQVNLPLEIQIEASTISTVRNNSYINYEVWKCSINLPT